MNRENEYYMFDIDQLETTIDPTPKTDLTGIFDIYEQNNTLYCLTADGVHTLNPKLNLLEPLEADQEIQEVTSLRTLSSCTSQSITYGDYRRLDDKSSYNPSFGKHLINKIILENSIDIVEPVVEIVYFDIETYQSANYGFPSTHDGDSCLAMVTIYRPKTDTLILICRSRYEVDVEGISAIFKTHFDHVPKIQIIKERTECLLSLRFYSYIRSIKSIVVLSGFNSSSSGYNVDMVNTFSKELYKNNARPGYDQPFLDKKSGLKIKYNNIARMNTSGMKFDTASTKSISILPNTYFFDYKQTFDVLTADQTNELVDHKLGSLLTVLGLPSKIDAGFSMRELQMKLHLNDEYSEYTNSKLTITDIAAYALADVYVLHLVEQTTNVVQSRLSICRLFNIPLNQALYDTMGNISELCAIKELYKDGYVCNYDVSNHVKLPYTGAYTETCATQKVHSNVLSGDFTSLYPSIIIALNISPETLVIKKEDAYISHRPTTDIREVEAEINNEQVNQYFETSTVGAIPRYLSSLLTRRSECKKLIAGHENGTNPLSNEEYQMQSIRSKLLKLSANALYGKMASVYTAFYNVSLAASITTFGRTLIKAMKDIIEKNGNKVHLIDTDGLLFEYTNKDSIDHLMGILLPKAIEGLGVSSKILRIEIDKIISKIYYPSQKKCYAYIPHRSMTALDGGEVSDMDVVIKGISWSKLSTNYIKKEIRRFFKHILLNCKDGDEIQLYINKFYSDHRKQLLAAIRDRDIDGVKNYAIRKRRDDKTLKLKDITINDDYVHLIRIVSSETRSKTELERVLDVEHLDNMCITSALEHICQPIKKFFTMKPTNIDTLLKRYNIQDGIPDDSLLLRMERFHKNRVIHDYAVINRDGIEQFVNTRKHNQSIHEVCIGSDEYYSGHFDFDIDLSQHAEITSDAIMTKFKTFMLRKIEGMPAMNWCEASNDKKISLHCIIQGLHIEMHYNRAIAKEFNDIMSHEVCDIAIYKPNHSLRVLGSSKMIHTTGDLIRPLKPIGDTKPVEFIIRKHPHGDISRTPYTYNNNPPFDIHSTKQYGRLLEEAVNTYNIKKKHDFKIINCNGTQVTLQSAKKCPVCNRVHKSDHQFMYGYSTGIKLNCFRNFNREHEEVLVVDFVTENEKKSKKTFASHMVDIHETINTMKTPEADEHTEVVNRKYVNYDLANYDTVYIKSALGTGKTVCLIEQLKRFSSILVISFRRTFTSDFVSKFRKAGIDIVSYMDIEDRVITTDKFPMVCIQIDSLYRYNGKPAIIIMDEIESILEQSKTGCRDNKTGDKSKFRFITLLQRSRCVFMDGLLQTSTIEFLESITHRYKKNMIFYYNQYKPKTDYVCNVFPICGRGASTHKVVDRIAEYISSGKRLMVMCTSRIKLNAIVSCLVKSNLLKDDEYIDYHGHDGEYNTITNETHKVEKHRDIPNINTLLLKGNIKLIIFSSTITAGLSIDIDYFDITIGILYAKTCSILSFVQGLHRVRSLKSKTLEVFYETRVDSIPFTPHQIYATKMCDYDISNLTTILDLRNETVTNYCARFGRKILILFLNEMGYNMSFFDDIPLSPSPIIPLELYKSECRDFDHENLTALYKRGEYHILTEKEFKELSNRMLVDELNETNTDLKYYEKKLHVKYCNWMIELEQFTRTELIGGLTPEQVNLLYQVSCNATMFKRTVEETRNKKLSYEERKQIINDRFKEERFTNLFCEQPEGPNKLDAVNSNEDFRLAREVLSRFQFDTMYTKDNIITAVADIDKLGTLGSNFQRTINSIIEILNYKMHNKQVDHGEDGKVRYYYITKVQLKLMRNEQEEIKYASALLSQLAIDQRYTRPQLHEIIKVFDKDIKLTRTLQTELNKILKLVNHTMYKEKVNLKNRAIYFITKDVSE